MVNARKLGAHTKSSLITRIIKFEVKVSEDVNASGCMSNQLKVRGKMQGSVYHIQQCNQNPCCQAMHAVNHCSSANGHVLELESKRYRVNPWDPEKLDSGSNNGEVNHEGILHATSSPVKASQQACLV